MTTNTGVPTNADGQSVTMVIAPVLSTGTHAPIKLLYGSGAPANTLGSDGDFYRNMDNDDMYGPKLTTWPTAFSIRGYKGDKGDKGDIGDLTDVDRAYVDAAKTAAAASQSAAKTSETNAKTSETNAASSKTAAATSASNAKTSETNSKTSETNAAASATAAAGSATQADASKSAASTSATAASGSASAASTSATNASNSAAAAASSASAAATSKTNAGTSETNAAASATAAASSATAAATSKTNAGTSETNALASKNAAATSASNAATSESNALASKNAAATSASNAATSESNAADSATAAASSASAADASKTAAASSASAAATSKTNAGTSETNAASSKSAAAGSATAAATSATNAANSAGASATSASASAASATAAKTSETNAKTSETNSATSEGNASASATAAAQSKTAAATSATAAAGSASDALGSANTAGTKATAAASSASAAATSESNAANSATAAAYARDAAQTAANSVTNPVSKLGDTMTGDLWVGDAASTSGKTLGTNYRFGIARNAAGFQPYQVITNGQMVLATPPASQTTIGFFTYRWASTTSDLLAGQSAADVYGYANPDGSGSLGLFGRNAAGTAVGKIYVNGSGKVVVGTGVDDKVSALQVNPNGATWAALNAPTMRVVDTLSGTGGGLSIDSYQPTIQFIDQSAGVKNMRMLMDAGALKFANDAGDNAGVYTAPGIVMNADGYMAIGSGVPITSTANLFVAGTGLGTGVNAYGVWSQVTHNTANTGNVGAFVSSPRTAAASYNVSNLMGYFASSPALGSGSTASSYAAFYADDFSGATNSNIGFRGRMTAAANKWNLYLDGTASNYLAGRTLIGTTTDDGSSKLQVAGNIAVTGNQTLTSTTNGTVGSISSGAYAGGLSIEATNVGNTAKKNLALAAWGGRVLVGTTTDDGVSAIQGIGALTMSGTVQGSNPPNLLPNGSGELGNSLWLSSKLASTPGSYGEGPMWLNPNAFTTESYLLDQAANFPCGPGVNIVLQGEFTAQSMTAGSSRAKVEAMDSTGTLISEVCSVSVGFGTTGWQFKWSTAVTPANTAYLRVSKIADFSPRGPALSCGIRKLKVSAGVVTPSLYSREANVPYTVDTLNAQTIGGAKTFSALMTANAGLASSGDVSMNSAGTYSYRLLLKAGSYAPFLRGDNTGAVQFINSANTAVNLNLSDSGALTVRNGIGLTAGDLTINAGYSLILKSGSGYFGYLRADNSSMIGFVNQASNQWNLQIFDGGTVMARNEVQAGNGSSRLAVDGNVWGAMWGSDWLSNWLATNKMSPRRGGNSKGYVFTDTDNNQTLNWEGSRSRLWIDGSNQGLLWTDAQISLYADRFVADTCQQFGFIGGDNNRPYMMQWKNGNAMELVLQRFGSGAYVNRPLRANGYIEWITDIGSIGTNYFSSDLRKKQNVAPSTRNATEVIEQIEFSQFEFKPEFDDPNHYDIGLIAQQLQTVEETFVNEMTDGMLMPNTNVLIPYALKAIKELAARIAKLEGVAA